MKKRSTRAWIHDFMVQFKRRKLRHLHPAMIAYRVRNDVGQWSCSHRYICRHNFKLKNLEILLPCDTSVGECHVWEFWVSGFDNRGSNSVSPRPTTSPNNNYRLRRWHMTAG